MPSDRLSLQRALPWIAGGGLATTLVCGLLVPVYTDEVAWRLQLSRSPLDGGVDRGLAEQCGANTTIAAPWFLQPMRHLTARGEQLIADPRSVRLLGVVLALVAVGLIVAIARAADRRPSGKRLALAMGLLGLGTTPWLLVWNRPEQPILLMLAAAVLLALTARNETGDAWMRGAAITTCAIVALGYHPKAVVFAPVFAAAAACTGRNAGGRWPRIAAVGLVILFAVQAFSYWNARLACPADPVIAAKQAMESAFAAHRPGDPWSRLIGTLAANLSPMGYVLQIGPGATQMGGWLPLVALPHALIIGWFALITIAWQFALLAVLAGLAFAARAGWRTWRHDRNLLLACAIFASLLAWSALQTNKNAYEAALMLPLATIALLLVMPAIEPMAPRVVAGAAAGTAVLAVISEALLIASYAPTLARTAGSRGAIPNQPASFSAWQYPSLRREILAAGRRCGVLSDRARYLLVDDLTYWPYLASWRPQHAVAVLGAWRGTIADPLAYLRVRRSSGAVIQCALLPPALRAQAKAQGQFCCIGLSGGAVR